MLKLGSLLVGRMHRQLDQTIIKGGMSFWEVVCRCAVRFARLWTLMLVMLWVSRPPCCVGPPAAKSVLLLPSTVLVLLLAK